MSFFEFPHTRTYDTDLGWLIKAVNEMSVTLKQFVSLNTIKYANPIQWNITTQYESNTVVIDPLTGTAYLSVQPVPSGVNITNTDYWTVIFDLGSFVVRAAKNFTGKFEEETTLTATFPSSVNDWLIWGDVLYRVISPIIAGDQYVIGSNIVHFTVEDVMGHIQDLTTTDKSNLVAAINELVQGLINEAARVDGITGDLVNLNTSDKSNLVAAINENFNEITNILLTLTTKIYFVNTVADLISFDGAIGDLVDTKGYYAINDGGAAQYNISDTAQAPSISLTNGLYANLITDDIYNADQLGFKHFANEADALLDGGADNLLLWQTLICDGSTTYHSKIKFGAGVYPFSAAIYIPTAMSDYESYNIGGIGGESELYFPTTKGFIPIPTAAYTRAIFHDMMIHASLECIDFYNDADADSADYIQHSYFKNLYVNSDTKDGIYAYPYVYTRHGLTDVQQFHNMFEQIYCKAPNGAGISGFNYLDTTFTDIGDNLGKCLYLMRNCSGIFQYCNSAFHEPDWFVYWDNPPAPVDVKFTIRECNIEGYMEGIFYCAGQNIFHTHVCFEYVSFIAIAKVGGVNYVRTHHPIHLGNFIYNLTFKRVTMDSNDGTAMTDLFPNMDCLLTVWNEYDYLFNSYGDTGFIYNRETSVKVPANMLTNSMRSTWRTNTYTRLASASAYLPANATLTMASMGNIVQIYGEIQVTANVPGNTPLFKITHHKPLSWVGMFGLFASNGDEIRLEINSSGEIMPSTSLPTGFYKVNFMYLSQGYNSYS